ncbi:MAG: Nif3-like dinuclear metal center hexameric protein [Methylophaga sp.]|nr:Nif3-like dinuclear metal center hexameric protein [Methylophaga sp.]
MIPRSELLAYLDDLLEPGRFQDYCPNGLQVAGNDSVERIVTGVTASQALIDAAITAEADTLIVHHGYFWRGEAPQITGMKQQRLKSLLTHNINLIGYHLPLDAHPELGNNVQLARLLGIEIDGRIRGSGDPAIALCGRLAQSMALTDFADKITQVLQRPPLTIAGHQRPIITIGWCTGAAQGYIQQAAEMGLDAFLSGEISEPTVHLARELGIHYIAAGHHATERYGVKTLGEMLARQWPVSVQFIDIDNPV